MENTNFIRCHRCHRKIKIGDPVEIEDSIIGLHYYCEDCQSERTTLTEEIVTDFWNENDPEDFDPDDEDGE